MIVVLFMNSTPVATTPLKRTIAPGTKPLPVMVTTVPLAGEPAACVIPLTVGAGVKVVNAHHVPPSAKAGPPVRGRGGDDDHSGGTAS